MSYSNSIIRHISFLFCIVFLFACNDDDDRIGIKSSTSQKANAYQELLDNGGAKYIGADAVIPISSEPLANSNVVIHSFPSEPGTRFPASMTGEPYKVQTRDGESDDLLFYFQGGGICAAESCLAFNFGNFLADRLPDLFDLFGGALSTDSSNPLANFDLVHANYSDGSLMFGDIDQQPRINALGGTSLVDHRGLLNMTATFEVAKRQYPNPSRIVVSGSSAGSLASFGALIFARTYYPGVPIYGILDSGTGVINEADIQFVERAARSMGFWDLISNIESCGDCFSNGHATNLLRWILDQDNEDEDKNIKLALLSSTQDHVISSFTLNPAHESDSWKNATERELTSLANEYPDRVRVFMIPGSTHTFLIGGGAMAGLIANGFLGLLFPEGFERTPQFDNFISVLVSPLIVGRRPDLIGSEHLKLGNYDQVGINMNNQRVSVKDFIREFLEDPATTVNVLNTE